MRLSVHVDEARDVLRPLDVAAHPVDRIGDAAQHGDCAPTVLASGHAGSWPPFARSVRLRRGSSASTQVSLLPPPCDELTTSEPFLERDARQAARQHEDVLAVEDVGPQVDVPSLERAVDDRRHARQRQRRLRDVVARVRLDPLARTRRAPPASSAGPTSMP